MRRVVLTLGVLCLGGLWGHAAPPATTPSETEAPEAEPSEAAPSETGQPEAAPSEGAPNANLPSFALRRGERPITVQQTALDEEGGVAITRGGRDCREDENISFFYAPDPKLIDTTVDNTRIRSSIVFRSQPKEGGAEAQDRAVIDFYGGSLEVNEETFCPRNLRRDTEQQVVITEGRTTVEGGALRYENSSGIGEMDGPVNLTIPRGATTGQKLRLRGRGINGGDQQVELKIVMPPRVDDDLAQFFEGWRRDHAYDPRAGMKAGEK